MSVLELACLWNFEVVFKTAVAMLEQEFDLDRVPARRVAIAARFNITKWLLTGLNALAQREEPMNKDDVAILGIDYVLKLAKVREMYPGDRSPIRVPKERDPPGRNDRDPQPLLPHRPPFHGPIRLGHGDAQDPFGFVMGGLNRRVPEPLKPSRKDYDFTPHIKQVFSL